MNWLPLTIFPEGSLASSIVTTVWVGVLVFSFMNLRFGWVYSGLVVPGYLVPLIIVKPWSAGVIVCEAILTLWTVQGLSRFLAKSGIACEFFGRDRFVLLLMVSAFYRVVGDVWVLPLAGEYLNVHLGIAFDYRNNLQGFGLIVICLAANQLWKTGVLRGGIPFVFNIAVTWLIIRYGLMEFTNFSITNLSFLYEDMASSVYAAPKAYIILITTAIIASRMNLVYGWDFNGILIPALIALQWYEPLKILTSFFEAAVVLCIAIQVLKLPVFRSMTMEGSRKLFLFFTISFLYKLAVGWGLYFIDPGVKVSDFYGFGYLLPTLMAIKMHQKERLLHQFRITTQVSVVAVLVANGIGFALTFMPATAVAKVELPTGVETRSTRTFDESELRYQATQTYIASHRLILEPDLIEDPELEDLEWFKQGLEMLLQNSDKKLLSMCGFTVDRFGDEYYRIAPLNPASGRPFLVVNCNTSGDLAVISSDCLLDRHIFDASLSLFLEQSARVLSIGNTESAWIESIRQTCDGFIDVCRNTEESGNRLYVKESLPPSLALIKLEESFGELTVIWEDSPQINPLRDVCKDQFCELHVTGRLPGALPQVVTLDEEWEPVDAWVRKRCAAFAPRASGLYKPPSPETLLYLDRHVLEPLFELNEQNYAVELTAIRSSAKIYGYEVSQILSGNDVFLLLHESNQHHFWGSVLVRLPVKGITPSQLCFQIPGRVRDQSLLTFASTQFRRFGARALIVSGTNTLTNPDASTRLSAASNRDSFFNLAHQAFCRSSKSSPPAVIQCRAYLPAPGQAFPEGDIIVAPYFGSFPGQTVDDSLSPIVQLLSNDGAAVAALAYDDATSPYAAGFNTQARYMEFTNQGTFALFWLSPFFRENFERQNDNYSLQKMLKAVGIPVSEQPLVKWVKGRSFGPNVKSNVKSCINNLRENYSVESLAWLAQSSGYHVSALLDPGSSQLFLCAVDRNNEITLIANPAPNALPRSSDDVKIFVDSRAAWFEKPSTPEAK